MNIFVLSRNVRTCAVLHCDQHVVKMPLETAQLLSTTLALTDPAQWAALREQQLAYLPTHQNHPCAIWARECINNYLWLARLGIELCAEYSFRFSPAGTRLPTSATSSGTRMSTSASPPSPHSTEADVDIRAPKVHKCLAVIRALRQHAPLLPDKRVITPFALVMPEEYRVQHDPVASYRSYYRAEKAAFARYTRRERPDWLPLPSAS